MLKKYTKKKKKIYLNPKQRYRPSFGPKANLYVMPVPYHRVLLQEKNIEDLEKLFTIDII